MTPGWLFFVTVTICLGVTPTLAKDAEPSVAALEATARAAYRAGDFQTAADTFGALLIRLPADDPARARTQYNRGRALQRAERPCAAAEALFGYLSNPQAKASRESRRRTKAEANLADARAACAQKAEAAPEAAAQVVDVPAAPAAPMAGRLMLEGGFGSGAHLTGGVERTRTTVLVGGGWAREAWLFDLIAEFAVEAPDDAEALVMVRPGVRRALGELLYLRASLPILLTPLTALGVQGGAGIAWPADARIAGFGETGVLAWFSSPVQITFEARLGVQATF